MPISYPDQSISILGCTNYKAIGVQNNSVPDSSMTASSYYDSYHNASNGRLHGNYGWQPRTRFNPDDYLQIDLGTAHVICAVATQGAGPVLSVYDKEWVTEYKLNYSMGQSDWTTYQENYGDKVEIPRTIDCQSSELTSNYCTKHNFDCSFISFIVSLVQFMFC